MLLSRRTLLTQGASSFLLFALSSRSPVAVAQDSLNAPTPVDLDSYYWRSPAFTARTLGSRIVLSVQHAAGSELAYEVDVAGARALARIPMAFNPEFFENKVSGHGVLEAIAEAMTPEDRSEEAAALESFLLAAWKQGIVVSSGMRMYVSENTRKERQ